MIFCIRIEVIPFNIVSKRYIYKDTILTIKILIKLEECVTDVQNMPYLIHE